MCYNNKAASNSIYLLYFYAQWLLLFANLMLHGFFFLKQKLFSPYLRLKKSGSCTYYSCNTMYDESFLFFFFGLDLKKKKYIDKATGLRGIASDLRT